MILFGNGDYFKQEKEMADYLQKALINFKIICQYTDKFNCTIPKENIFMVYQIVFLMEHMQLSI